MEFLCAQLLLCVHAMGLVSMYYSWLKVAMVISLSYLNMNSNNNVQLLYAFQLTRPPSEQDDLPNDGGTGDLTTNRCVPHMPLPHPPMLK